MKGMHFRPVLSQGPIDILDVCNITRAIVELCSKKAKVLMSLKYGIEYSLDVHVSDYLSLACEDWQCSARRLQARVARNGLGSLLRKVTWAHVNTHASDQYLACHFPIAM